MRKAIDIFALIFFFLLIFWGIIVPAPRIDDVYDNGGGSIYDIIPDDENIIKIHYGYKYEYDIEGEKLSFSLTDLIINCEILDSKYVLDNHKIIIQCVPKDISEAIEMDLNDLTKFEIEQVINNQILLNCEPIIHVNIYHIINIKNDEMKKTITNTYSNPIFRPDN